MVIKDEEKITKWIDLGYKCNNNCIFCFHDYDVRKRYDDFCKNYSKDNDTIKKEIKEIYKKLMNEHPKSKKIINFVGGEPTIRNDIIDLINYSKKIGFKVMLTSNGRMFSYEKFTKKVLNSGLETVQLSIHGPNEKIHDYLTKTNYSFKQAISGLKNLKEHNLFVSNKTVIVESNVNYLKDIIEELSKYGVDLFYFTYPSMVGKLRLNENEIISDLSKIKDNLNKAIFSAKEKNKAVIIECIPHCVLKDNFEYIMSFPKKEDHVKPKECIHCAFNDECSGIFKEYLERFEKYSLNQIQKEFKEKYFNLKNQLNNAKGKDYTDTLNDLGFLFWKNNNTESSINYYLKSIKYNPEGDDQNPMRAFMNYYQETDKAITAFKKTLALNPSINHKNVNLEHPEKPKLIENKKENEFESYMWDRREGNLESARKKLKKLIHKNNNDIILLNELNTINNLNNKKDEKEIKNKIDELFSKKKTKELNYYSPYLDNFSYNLSEFISLITGIKPLMRSMVEYEKIKKTHHLKQITRSNNLKLKIPQHKVYYDKFPELIMNLEHPEEGGFVDYFISNDEKKIKEAMITDFESKIFRGGYLGEKFGIQLGYPECCSKNFAHFYKENFYPKLKTVNKINFVMNSLLQGHGNIFISHHIPCSINCNKTANLNKKILEEIKYFDYLYYKTIKYILRKPILVWIDRRIHARHNWILKPRILFHNAEYKDEIIHYEDATILPPLNQFKKIDELSDDNKNSIKKCNQIKINENEIIIMKNNKKIKTIKNSNELEATLFLPQ